MRKILERYRQDPVPASTCDPGWRQAYVLLEPLHAEKSATYGTDQDRLSNFTAVAALTGAPAERYALLRIVEKAQRALNMIDHGNATEVREYPDIASLALCCEALRLRSDRAA